MSDNFYNLIADVEDYSPISEYMTEYGRALKGGFPFDSNMTFENMHKYVQFGYLQYGPFDPALIAGPSSPYTRAYEYGSEVRKALTAFRKQPAKERTPWYEWEDSNATGWDPCKSYKIRRNDPKYFSSTDKWVANATVGWYREYVVRDSDGDAGNPCRDNGMATVCITHYCAATDPDDIGPTWQVVRRIEVEVLRDVETHFVDEDGDAWSEMVETEFVYRDETDERVDHIVYRSQDSAELACKMHTAFDYRNSHYIWESEEMLRELKDQRPF